MMAISKLSWLGGRPILFFGFDLSRGIVGIWPGILAPRTLLVIGIDGSDETGGGASVDQKCTLAEECTYKQ
jgi:hypothetical protein